MLFNAEGTFVHNAAKEAMEQFVKEFKEVEAKLLEEERNDRADENHCCLCGGSRFNFEPPVFYCNGKRVDAMDGAVGCLSGCVHEWIRERTDWIGRFRGRLPAFRPSSLCTAVCIFSPRLHARTPGPCQMRIRRNSHFHYDKDNKYHYCTKCWAKMDQIVAINPVDGAKKIIPKANFRKKKNDETVCCA